MTARIPETVWRYRTPLAAAPVLDMPTRARILTVAPARDGEPDLELWAAVDPTAPPEARHLRVVGTGHAVPRDAGRFLGTVTMRDGAFVWHVFEATS